MHKFIFSLKCAINGLKTVAKEERNFQIHVICAIAVIIVSILLEVTKIEMAIIITAIVFILASEIINTTIEDLCDKIELNQSPLIGKIKDMMAGFVLVSVLGAITIASIILLPHLIALI